MKNRYLLVLFALHFISVHYINAIGNGDKNHEQNIKNNELTIGENQNILVDTDKIIFFSPAVKCGIVKWNDPAILKWLANDCVDKCEDANSSGYKYSGKINNPQKGWSLKVTITTDRDYLQPVRFNPDDGTFNGKIYFDKTNRQETPIKMILRDSNRIAIQTFIVKLTE